MINSTQEKIFIPKEILMKDPSWISWWNGKSEIYQPSKKTMAYMRKIEKENRKKISSTS